MATDRHLRHLQSLLIELAHHGAQAEEPLVECGCLALIQGLNLDPYRRKLLAHVFMDLTNAVRPDTSAEQHVLVPHP